MSKSRQPLEEVLLTANKATVRLLAGALNPSAADGRNTLKTLAYRVEEVDLVTLPCDCSEGAICLSCASFDARAREREFRQGGWK